MSKDAERNYLEIMGEAGRIHSLGKPFSDDYCGINLSSIGAIMSLLPSPPARILDMGCGGGWTSIFYAKRGYTVVGQDISDDMIKLAQHNQAQQLVGGELSFINSDFEDIHLDGQFDAVIFYDCLHHADDERAAILSAFRALKPGGLLITHEPGEGHSLAPGSIEAMKVFGVNEKDMPPHLIIKHGMSIGFLSSRIYPMQNILLEVFYGDPIPRLLSKAGWERIKRVFKLAFRPSQRASSIVVLSK